MHLLQAVDKTNDPVFQQFVRMSQIPFMGADTLEVILKHYSSRTFRLVKELYRDDIKAFGYVQDVDLLGQIIASSETKS